MTDRNQLKPLIWLGFTILAIVLLAAGLSNLELLSGRPFPFALFGPSAADTADASPIPLPAPALGFLGLVFALAFAIVLGLWIIVFMLRPQARKRMLNRLLAYLLALLLLHALLFAIQRRFLTAENEVEPESITDLAEFPMPTEGLPAPPAFVIDPPQWLIFATTVALIALVLGLVWFVWRHRFTKRTTPQQLLVREAEQAVEELRLGKDLKDTVLRCYHDMTQILKEQHGIERQEAMTPREFETYLSEMGLQDEHIRRLTRLFEGVRYGANTAEDKEEREALACLSTIVEAYGRAS